MNRSTSMSTRSERGQTLVITAIGLVVMIGLVGLVIDGGHAWGKLRQTQNGADAVAKSGAVVIQQMLAEIGTPTDGTVGCAVADMAAANDVDLISAEYTDHLGAVTGPVGACGSGAPIPDGAQGVKATTEDEFDTFLGGIVGVQTFTATTDATAVVGVQQDVCPAAAGCGALPVTFPQVGEICDDTEFEFTIGEMDTDGIYEPYELLPEGTTLTQSNMAIIPLCPGNPGLGGLAGLRVRQPRQPHREPLQRQHPDPELGADPHRKHQLLRGRARRADWRRRRTAGGG